MTRRAWLGIMITCWSSWIVFPPLGWSQSAILLTVDEAGSVQVVRNLPSTLTVAPGAWSLVVWREGGGERWQVVEGGATWERSTRRSRRSADRRLVGGSRGGPGQNASELGVETLATVSLDQLMPREVLKGRAGW